MNKKLQETINELAEILPYGNLLSCTDSVGFLKSAIDEIKELRNDLVEALTLLEQGRTILSNESIIKVQGDFVGQVTFVSWAEKVDALLANSHDKEVAE